MTEEPGHNSPGLFKCPGASFSSSSVTSAENSRRSRGRQLLLLRVCLAETPTPGLVLLRPRPRPCWFSLRGYQEQGGWDNSQQESLILISAVPYSSYSTGPSVLSSLQVQFPAWRPLFRRVALSSPHWPSQKSRGILDFPLPLAQRAKVDRVRQDVPDLAREMLSRAAAMGWRARCSWAPERGLDTGRSTKEVSLSGGASLASKGHSTPGPNTECL